MRPPLQPNDLLLKLWRPVCEILRLPLEQQIGRPAGTNEPPLDEKHWPIIIAIVAGQFVKMTKDVLDPRISFALAMESAVISSKFDPERVEPGKWEVRAAAGRLAVRRLRQ